MLNITTDKFREKIAAVIIASFVYMMFLDKLVAPAIVDYWKPTKLQIEYQNLFWTQWQALPLEDNFKLEAFNYATVDRKTGTPYLYAKLTFNPANTDVLEQFSAALRKQGWHKLDDGHNWSNPDKGITCNLSQNNNVWILTVRSNVKVR